MSDAAIRNISTSNPLENSESDTDDGIAATGAGENAAEETRLGRIIYHKRAEFLNHVLHSLDIIIYLHFSYLYFLDCNLFRFILSSLIQLWFLTPKPENIPPPRQKRSVLVALFGVAAFRVVRHVLSTSPMIREEMYGYLHGGLIIDFVGQRGPTSKWRLFIIDSFVLLLQLIMLCLITVKEDIPIYTIVMSESRAIQGLEDEERGERQRIYNPDGTPHERDTSNNTADEEERLKLEMERRSFQITSGEFEVANIDIINVVRRQWSSGRTLVDDQNTGSSTASAEVLRRGRAWRFTFAEHTGAFR